MISKIFLFLLPAVLSEITIDISDQEVQFLGDSVDLISDAERETFRITDGSLKDAVNRYTQGRPDNVYVKSPTPWDDLYKKFGWSEVRRTLRVKSARVIGKSLWPQVIATKKFYNGSPRPATYAGDVFQMEDNTIVHKWTKSGCITVGQKINYNVKIAGNGIGDTTNFAFKSTFGEETVSTVSTELGSKSSISISVTLQPGQTAVAVLTANKRSMDVEVEYEATLSGSVACNYGSPHKGHHFWAFDVNGVLDAGGLPRSVVWREVLSVGYYANGSVVAYDANGNPL